MDNNAKSNTRVIKKIIFQNFWTNLLSGQTLGCHRIIVPKLLLLLLLLSSILYCLSLVLLHKMCSQNRSFIKYFHKIPLLWNIFTKSDFMGILELASQWAVMPVEVRLPTSGSLQTLQKWGPHWEVLLLLKKKLEFF